MAKPNSSRLASRQTYEGPDFAAVRPSNLCPPRIFVRPESLGEFVEASFPFKGMHWDHEPICLSIPKGLRNKAQGCEERATLGQTMRVPNPERVSSTVYGEEAVTISTLHRISATRPQ